MTGHNHPSYCQCGWCVGGWRNHHSRAAAVPARQSSFFRWSVRWRYDSFTIPNARCPRCGASVFFYRSPYGGSVFFDELGPPWPKHPCMDNDDPLRSAVQEVIGLKPLADTTWQRDGWIAIAIDSVRQEDAWFVLRCKALADGKFFRLLSTTQLEGVVGAPVFMSPLDTKGKSRLSFLLTDGTAAEAIVYDYGTHCLSEPAQVEERQSG